VQKNKELELNAVEDILSSGEAHTGMQLPSETLLASQNVTCDTRSKLSTLFAQKPCATWPVKNTSYMTRNSELAW